MGILVPARGGPVATVYGGADTHLAGDFNGDGKTDIAQTDRLWGSIPLCLATGGGGWPCSNPGSN